MSKLDVIGFDADDTLWENEVHYKLTEARFTELLGGYADPSHLSERLLAAERRNLGHYGYGIKGFTLSMIETALEVTGGQVPTPVIQRILDAGRALHSHPTPLLPHAEETVTRLSKTHKVVLITKGDLFDQERKLAQSGLGELFNAVEIVSHKTVDTYRTVFARHGADGSAGLMVGNSLKSDVIPMIEAGGWAVHVPHAHAWAMEAAEPPVAERRFKQIDSLAALPDLIKAIETGQST